MKILWIKKFSDRSGPNPSPEWDYYLERHFAWLPKMFNGGGVFPSFCWLCFWYMTYPVDDGGRVVELYRWVGTRDPRKPYSSSSGS